MVASLPNHILHFPRRASSILSQYYHLITACRLILPSPQFNLRCYHLVAAARVGGHRSHVKKIDCRSAFSEEYAERCGQLQKMIFRTNSSAEFPCEAFLEILFEMTIDFVQGQAADHPNQNFYILKAELASAVKRVETAFSSQADSLRMAYALRTRRSPKRGLLVDDSEPSRLVNIFGSGVNVLISLDYPLHPRGEEFWIRIALPLVTMLAKHHISINVHLLLPHQSRRQPWIPSHLILPLLCFAL